jgi:hypothetical protein
MDCQFKPDGCRWYGPFSYFSGNAEAAAAKALQRINAESAQPIA